MPDSRRACRPGNRAAGLLVDCLRSVACIFCPGLSCCLSVLQEVSMPTAATERAVVGRPACGNPPRVRLWHLVPGDVFVHDEQPSPTRPPRLTPDLAPTPSRLTRRSSSLDQGGH